MVRQLLTPGATTAASLTTAPVVAPVISQAQIDARLRLKRSSAYLESMRKLDAGGHTQNRQAIDALADAMRAEFPEITIDSLPVGIVAKCWLGEPYEVHSLDRLGNIITHYKRHEAMPSLLEKGRSLAGNPYYEFVEIYTDKIIAVTPRGDTSIVKD